MRCFACGVGRGLTLISILLGLFLWFNATGQCESQLTGRWCRIALLKFLKLVGAAKYVIIGGSCANPQSPQLGRYMARYQKKLKFDIQDRFEGNYYYPIYF